MAAPLVNLEDAKVHRAPRPPSNPNPFQSILEIATKGRKRKRSGEMQRPAD